MTLGKLTLSDNVVKIVAITVTLLGVGAGWASVVNGFREEQQQMADRLEIFVFDVCTHTPPDQRVTYFSCRAMPGIVPLPSGGP